MPVVTITVNQWRIKSNAETGAREPVVCVNTYEYGEVFFEPTSGEIYAREWGPKVGETEHYRDFIIPEGAYNIRTVYDPVNKTPCQASCWMQFSY